jgi:serine/threonine-protein kinase
MDTGELTSGQLVGGKYLLVSEIGAGGMGTVWAARNQATDAEVALKIWRDDGRDADAENTRTRFRNEAKLSAMLAHRNVVRVFDLLTEPDGTLVLVMERLRGCSLASYLRTYGRLDERATLAVASGLLAALDQAHRAGIVHRDMKPANVFLAMEADGHVTPKLLDFGIAKVPTANTSLTLDGSVLGTPRYMSPEQIRSKDLDGRSDLFSLGTVLYEALTGISPFDADTAGAALAMVLEMDVDPDPSLSPQLWSALSRALAKKPYERPATAAELAASLRAAVPCNDTELDQALRALNITQVAEEPVVIPALPPSFERGKRASRLPIYLGLGGVLTLALTLGITLGRVRSSDDSPGHAANAGSASPAASSSGSVTASNAGNGSNGAGGNSPSGSETGGWGAMPAASIAASQSTSSTPSTASMTPPGPAGLNQGGGGVKAIIKRPTPASSGSGKRPVATTPGF